MNGLDRLVQRDYDAYGSEAKVNWGESLLL